MNFRIPTNRRPSHPGHILLKEFLEPMGITQKELADGIKTPYQRVNDLVHGRRSVTPATAVRLAKFFDTSPDMWMNLQMRCDLYDATRDEGQVLKTIKTWCAPPQQAAAN